ncbi:MAG: hypothetical protein ACLRY5_03210 [Zhenhengia sp.]
MKKKSSEQLEKKPKSLKTKAFKDIELEKERVQAEMKAEMIEVASLMASKFVAASMDENKQNELVDEMIKEMGDVQWLR